MGEIEVEGSGRMLKRVDESGREWKKMEESGRNWNRVEVRGWVEEEWRGRKTEERENERCRIIKILFHFGRLHFYKKIIFGLGDYQTKLCNL